MPISPEYQDQDQGVSRSQPGCAASPATSEAEPAAAVWIVMGSTGEYSDRSEWTVYAFRDENDAQGYVQFLTEKRQQVGVPAGSWEQREVVEAAMSDFDPGFSEDYTGTRWWAERVEFAPSLGREAASPAPGPVQATEGQS